MTDDEFLTALKTQLGTIWLFERAADAFGVPSFIIKEWVNHGRSPSPHAIHMLKTVQKMDPRDLPIAWQHWDCRTDLHGEHARYLAARRGDKAAEAKASALSDDEKLRLYDATRKDAHKKLTT